MACKPPVEYADPRDVGQLAEPLRSRIAQAIKDAPTGGLILVSGKRTDWQQWLLRHDRCPGRECDPGCKGSPTTARPGRSNHRNISADIAAADMGGRDLDWLIANERKYGLARTVPGEKWHFEVVGPATVPITPYGKPSKPPKWIPFKAGDSDKSIFRAGGMDNEVSELQLRLSALSESWKNPRLDPGAIDGDYGPKSQAAVKEFKRRVIDLQRLTKQPVWPNTDTVVGEKTIAMLRWWTA